MKAPRRVNYAFAVLVCCAFVLCSWPAGSAFAAAAPSKSDAANKKKAAKEESAQAAQPYISSIFPAGGQRGKNVRVTISGQNLASVRSIRINGKGVTASLSGTNSTDTVIVTVSVALDADPGEHDLRVLTPGGPSNRFRFLVGDLPEINEVEPNSEFSQAQVLPALPVVINGRLFQADRDIYRFPAKAGEEIVCEVQARALLPYIADAVPGWCDAALTLCDAQGRKLAAVDDFRFKPDPVLLFRVPEDGDYFIVINDVLFRGRADFVYRLTVGAVPWVTQIFPLGGQRGTTVEVELTGVNLPTRRVTLALAQDAPPLRTVRLEPGGLPDNRLPFAVGAWPESRETEPNDSLATANRVEVPVIINGRIDQPGDSDYFKFKVKSGARLVMEVFARRLDSPLDSLLTLLDAGGRELQENDDTVDPEAALVTHHADSRIAYTFRQAGDYVLRIRDTQTKGGDEYAYRLAIGPERPDFALRVTPDNPRVGRGETTMLTVDALRKDGFTNDITLAVKELAQGFSASSAVVPAGENQAVITITAPLNAGLGVAAPSIFGQATIGGETISRRAFPAETVMQAFAYTYYVPTRELLLAIVEAAPFSIAARPGTNEVLDLRRDGELQVPIKVTRRENGQGPVSVTLVKPPTGVLAKAVLIAADAGEGTLTITASKQAPLGRHNVIINGTLRSGKGISVIAPALALNILPAQ